MQQTTTLLSYGMLRRQAVRLLLERGVTGNVSEERRRVSDLDHTQDMAWTQLARCRGLDPDLFFVRSASEAREAARICHRCGVKEACLRYALEHEIEFGVWGGLTERQRRAYQRRVAS